MHTALSFVAGRVAALSTFAGDTTLFIPDDASLAFEARGRFVTEPGTG